MTKSPAKSKLIRTVIALAILQAAGIPHATAADLDLGNRVPTTSEVIETLAPGNQRISSTTPGVRLKYRGSSPKSRGIELTQARLPQTSNVPSLKPSPSRSTGDGVSIPVLFGFDSYDLTPRAIRQLVPIAEALNSKELAGLIFRVEGHTDVTGPASYNYQLSTKRADKVRDHLVEQHEIPSERVLIVGLGESVLANPAFPEDPGNRRVRIVVHVQ